LSSRPLTELVMNTEPLNALNAILQSVKQAQSAAETALSAAESALETERRISQRLDMHEKHIAQVQLMRELDAELNGGGV